MQSLRSPRGLASHGKSSCTVRTLSSAQRNYVAQTLGTIHHHQTKRMKLGRTLGFGYRRIPVNTYQQFVSTSEVGRADSQGHAVSYVLLELSDRLYR